MEGTCYHEFYKGKWDGKTFWKKDSICLHDEVLNLHSGFEKVLLKAVPSFEPFGESEVFPEQWNKIKELIEDESPEDKELFCEADEWVRKTFEEYDRFTIIGI